MTKIDSTNLRVKLLSASASFVASHAAIYTVDNGTTATVTMTSASPCVITWTAHGFSAGQAVRFTSTGALYTGLTAGVWYYVIATGLSTNTFQVSATVGGAAINTSGSQSGTHTGLSAGPYEVWGNAWPAGGVTLTTVAASTVTTNDATITADNVGITASGGGIGRRRRQSSTMPRASSRSPTTTSGKARRPTTARRSTSFGRPAASSR